MATRTKMGMQIIGVRVSRTATAEPQLGTKSAEALSDGLLIRSYKRVA